MKYLLKYSFLCLILLVSFAPLYAKNNRKKQTSTLQSKNKKSIKKGRSKKQVQKNIKLSKSKKGKVKKLDNIDLYNEQTHYNTISKNATNLLPIKSGDSIPEKVVTILSAFKPQLKNIAKVSFTNASALTDTTSVIFSYQVPSQNLSFRYKPITLIPRAYRTDSAQKLFNSSNIKVGVGNYNHYYIGLNTSFQDIYKNAHSFNLYNESTDGNHHLQTLKETGFNYIGDIGLNESNQLITQVYFKQSKRNRYGLVADSTSFPNENYSQNYYLTGLSLSWQNLNNIKRRLQYNPSLHIAHFEGILGAYNNYIQLNSTFYIQLRNGMQFNFDFNTSLSLYHPKSTASQSNNLITIEPSLKFNKFNSNFKIGVMPVASTEGFNIYPMVEFAKKLKDTNYELTLGWKTSLINNQYSDLVQTNPWLTMPTEMKITSKEQKFVRININASKYLNYGFILSSNEYKNLPLFYKLYNTNRSLYGLFYQNLFEPKAATLELDAYLNYQFSEKMIVHNSLKYIQFNSLQQNIKPWGVLPFEFNTKFSWIPNSKWIVDGGVQYWSGPTLNNESNLPVNLKSALILNAGCSYKLTKNWTIWAKGENLLDKPIERWADYPSLGVQLIAGFVYSFRK
jgi:hypothetical protein